PGHEERLRADLASLRIERNAPPQPAGRRRPPRRRAPVVIGVAILAVVAIAAWRISGRAVPVTVAYATLVAPGEVGPAPVLSGSGYIVTGDRYVSIGVRVAGRIDHYFVEEGQTVHKGEALVQLDDRDYRAIVARTEAGLQVAHANLDLAESDRKRGEALRTQGVISQQELDTLRNKAAVARATIGQLEAELAQARVNLEYTVLRAPADGVVLAKLKEVGEIAVPGGFAGSGDLVRLANLSDIRAEVDVNEADLSRVHMGQPALVTPDAYPEARYDAEVVKMYPQVDRQKGTLKIEVRVLKADARLLPDMSARITFLSEPRADGQAEKPSVLVPAAAVQRDARGDNVVWVVREGRARQTRVETAGEVGGRVRIANGLKGGEAVVIGSPPTQDGQKVTVAAPG
ncbi:MAG TPA: efflux RND transporter periplasmic adaptor subunit, partial [Candidatus Margulisiibacteriota bacterium]|nr:efflux RND transporter periplasmic adaptor subunit [Candidatus Margulisiibacteriota bacterium]